jgi:hypothetical protein
MVLQRWLWFPLVFLPEALLASGAGTSGGTILNMPLGARAIAMGEAYTAQADDASSLHWNPAGLSFLNQSQASFMYNPIFQDLTQQTAAMAVPLEYGAVGANVSYLSYGHINGYDAAGNSDGNVSAYSGMATLGGSWLGDNWSLGAAVKDLQESLAGTKATGVGADVGAAVVYPKEVYGGTLRAGATVRNLGTGVKFINQTDPFPREWRLGVAAVQMMRRRLNVSLDYGQERDQNGAAYVGAEYWLVPMIALRAGYAGTQAEGSGLRGGIGLRFKSISFDYAFSSYGDVGVSHRYELSMRFGEVHERLSHAERELYRRAKVALAQERYGDATLLFDAFLHIRPDYRPAHRLMQVAMAGYERGDRSSGAAYDTTLVGRSHASAEDAAETKEIENLLRAADEMTAQRRNEENPQ